MYMGSGSTVPHNSEPRTNGPLLRLGVSLPRESVPVGRLVTVISVSILGLESVSLEDTRWCTEGVVHFVLQVVHPPGSVYEDPRARENEYTKTKVPRSNDWLFVSI